MRKRRWWRVGWLAALALIYAMFWTWYGGGTTPLTAAEGGALLDQIAARNSTNAGHPEFRRNVEALVAQDDGREFVMVNLETLRTGAAAERADAAYAQAVVPALLKRGGFPIYVGRAQGPVLGEDMGGVNRVALVRYRSMRDFLKTNLDPLMTQGVPYKFASLAETRVFATKPLISAVQVRIMVGLALALVAVAGLEIVGRLARRSAPDLPDEHGSRGFRKEFS